MRGFIKIFVRKVSEGGLVGGTVGGTVRLCRISFINIRGWQTLHFPSPISNCVAGREEQDQKLHSAAAPTLI
jgi:hypothetical protein